MKSLNYNKERLEKAIKELETLYAYYSEMKQSFKKESKEYRSLLWYRNEYDKLMEDLGLAKRGNRLICTYCKRLVELPVKR